MNQEQLGKQGTPYNVLYVLHTTCTFLIWHVWGYASVIACLSHPSLLLMNEIHKQMTILQLKVTEISVPT